MKHQISWVNKGHFVIDLDGEEIVRGFADERAAEAICRVLDARLPHAPVCVVEIRILRPDHITPEALAASFDQMAHQLPGFMAVSMREEFPAANEKSSSLQ